MHTAGSRTPKAGGVQLVGHIARLAGHPRGRARTSSTSRAGIPPALGAGSRGTAERYCRAAPFPRVPRVLVSAARVLPVPYPSPELSSASGDVADAGGMTHTSPSVTAPLPASYPSTVLAVLAAAGIDVRSPRWADPLVGEIPAVTIAAREVSPDPVPGWLLVDGSRRYSAAWL